MKLPWFKRIGFLFIPASVAGWLLLFAGIAFLAYTFISIDGRSHSVSDTLRPFIIVLLATSVVYSLIGWLTCKK